MNVLSANFQELYERHLCRHSQFGLNVAHLISVIGTYTCLFGIITWLVPAAWAPWVLLGLMIPYLAILSLNLPARVLLANTLFLGLLLAAFLALPKLAIGWYLVGVLVFYKTQAWSHRLFNRERDMTEFNKKYRKGFPLFVLLSVFELPILLNYLFFGKRDWCA